jgi:hypothetical protein
MPMSASLNSSKSSMGGTTAGGWTTAGDNFCGGNDEGGVWRSLAARRINRALWCVSEARRRREERGLVRQRRLYQRRRDGKAAENSRRWDGGCINDTNRRSLLVMEWSCPFWSVGYSLLFHNR